MREACWEMQSYAAKKGCVVITSSSDATDHFQKYLDHGSDIVIIGEAEQALAEVCTHINEPSYWRQIEGLAIKQDAVPHLTTKRKVMKDLDSLPPPAWDLIDVSPYKNLWLQHHGYFSLNFVTTRGCPYKCNWCAKPIYGNRYNTHSAENIAEQIKKQQQQIGFTHVWFADDIFGLKPSWVIDFAIACKKNELRISYKIQSRADLLVSEEYVKALAESGCKEVWMGAESGSQKILDAMDKGTTVEEIKIARRLLKKYNIKASFFLQFGYLGEDFDDIKKTMSLVKETLPDDLGISVSYPLPGTKFYEKVKMDLTDKSNWSDSDDLTMMFKNTYSPAFYKTLHRLVHSIHRKEKAVRFLAEKNSVASRVRPAIAYLKYSLKGFIQYRQLKSQMN